MVLLLFLFLSTNVFCQEQVVRIRNEVYRQLLFAIGSNKYDQAVELCKQYPKPEEHSHLAGIFVKSTYLPLVEIALRNIPIERLRKHLEHHLCHCDSDDHGRKFDNPGLTKFLCQRWILIHGVENFIVSIQGLRNLSTLPKASARCTKVINDFISFLEEKTSHELKIYYQRLSQELELHRAIIEGDPEKVKSALAAGAFCQPDVYNRYPLEKAEDVLRKKGSQSCQEVASLLKSYVQHRDTVVETLATTGELDEELMSILPLLCSPYIRDNTGNTILHSAVGCNNIRLVRKIVEINKDLVTAVNNNGQNPIYCIFRYSRFLMLAQLLGTYSNIPDRLVEEVGRWQLKAIAI